MTPPEELKVGDFVEIKLSPHSNYLEGTVDAIRINEGGEQEYWVSYIYPRRGGKNYETRSWVKRGQLRPSIFARFYEQQQEGFSKNP